MLHYETISPDCRELLTELMRMPELKRFRLVGGTALSLQFGHRVSVDIDLFTDKTFDEEGLERTLLALHPTTFSKERTTSTGFSCYVAGVKIDFLQLVAAIHQASHRRRRNPDLPSRRNFRHEVGCHRAAAGEKGLY